MGYSADIFWHQTTKDGFAKIMKSSMFKCAYSLESINWGINNKTFAIPMISFCNLPLCDLTEYLGKYGDYTIGMKQTWEHASKLSLVWYRDKNSISLFPLMDTLAHLKTFPTSDIDKVTESLIWSQLSHTKNYEGPLKRRNIKCYRFFDEFEFRYVPSIDDIKFTNINPILTEIQYKKYKENNKKSSIVNNNTLALPFKLKDIEFILVKSDVQSVTDIINKFFPKYSKMNSIKPLILTYDEVRRNIIGIEHHTKG